MEICRCCFVHSHPDVFEENGHEWHAVESEAGEKCLADIDKKAKWGVDVATISDHFLENVTQIIEKKDNCKMNYTLYMKKLNVYFNNGFGEQDWTNLACVKNNKTGKYTALIFGDLEAIDRFASRHRGNMCQQYDAVASAIENGDI